MARCLALSGVEVASGVVVELAGGEHVPDGDEHGVFDGDDCFDGSSAGSDATVLGGKVGVVAAGCGHGCDPEGSFEVGVAWPGAGRFDPPRRLVASGAGPGP